MSSTVALLACSADESSSAASAAAVSQPGANSTMAPAPGAGTPAPAQPPPILPAPLAGSAGAAPASEFGNGPAAQPVPEAPPADPSVPATDDSAERERMYVINTGSNSLSVIHVARREVIATIPLGGKPHGLATSGAGDRVYVTTEDTGEVIALDALTDEILWRTRVGRVLNEPALTLDDRFLFTPDRDAQRISIVDVGTGQQMEELRVPLPTLHNSYVSWDGAHIYQTSITGQAIVQIDAESRTILRQYAIDGQPRPVQIMADESKLFTQLSALNGFIQVDLATGDESARIEWPEPRQLPPGYDPQAKCHGLGLTHDNSEIWATSSMLSQVRVYTVPALQPVAEIDIGPVPNWMDFTRDGKQVFVSSQVPAEANGEVAIIDTASKKVVATLEVGSLPKRIHGLVLPK
jgi:YVTN family beta-propeller protein